MRDNDRPVGVSGAAAQIEVAAHTPGPWNFCTTGPVMKGYQQPYAIAQIGERNLIAGAFGDVRGGEEIAHANARLISAAPELLAALEETVSCFVGSTQWDGEPPAQIQRARAAIAKARGGV